MNEKVAEQNERRLSWRTVSAGLALLIVIAGSLLLSKGAVFTALVFGGLLIWSIGSFAAITLLGWSLGQLKSSVQPIRTLLLSVIPLASISAAMLIYEADFVLKLAWACVPLSALVYLPRLVAGWYRDR